MPEIRFLLPNGQEQLVASSAGMSLMEIAVRNGIHGITADCGGACTCATCHLYVGADWLPKLGPTGATEEVMLDFVPDRRETSRLSCQIHFTNALDGLVVEVPASQA